MENGGVSVFLYKDQKRLEVLLPTDLTAEEVIVAVARHLNFRPISLHVFGLRLLQKNFGTWLPLNYKFCATESYQTEFRMRFRLPSLTSLNRLDENAGDYIFHQIRHDVLHGQILEFCQNEHKPQCLGLCATDMIRAILEEKRSRDEVLKSYQQFVPKSIYKQHFLVLKKKLQEHIDKILPHNVSAEDVSIKFIKEQYISHAEAISSTYLTEEFSAMTFKQEQYPTNVRVDPLQNDSPGISMAYAGKQDWEHVCTIEDLCFISMREDCTVEISRKNGIPICLKFKSLALANSFVSLLDGYYRLTEKWTFNLCKDVFTPSLTKLRLMKCHGPVGIRFSCQKLSTHPSTKRGWFILRQSSDCLDEYCIDFIPENKNRPLTREVKNTETGKLKLEKCSEEFSTITELVSHYILNPTPDFYIKDCLPPSEYDRSPLLLCRTLQGLNSLPKVTSTVDSGGIAPQVITPRSLEVYRGQKFEFDGKLCKVIQARWKQNSVTTINVAIKLLKKEYEDQYTKDLLELASQCVLWQCECLVALKGVVLGNPQALVLEWMPHGPLGVYLETHEANITTMELIEAASHISKALWFLEDHGIVHGNIRCHNVLVFDHSDNGLMVKLSDPSLSDTSQIESSIHWIPPEFFEIPGLSTKFATADVWALGTTLWEIFSYGAKPPDEIPYLEYKGKYLSGWRLPRPEKCPLAIQRIILECWSQLPDTRKQPQAIVRDIHQILYQLIGSRRVHSYSLVSPATSETGTSQPNSVNTSALDITDNFNWTTFGSDTIQMDSQSNGTLSTFMHDLSIHSGSQHSRNTQATWLDTNGSPSPDLISGFSDYTNGSIGTVYSLSSAVGIYEFRNNQVTLGRMIGQGFYGAVFLGEIVRTDGSKEGIAIKKLKEKRDSLDTAALDFRRELEILQKLCHPNIVEVKGVVYDPDLLLIMEYLPMGSLLDYFKISCLRKPNTRQLLKFTQDVAEGMDYLSSNNIVHRDLAARNLLVANDDLVKISDFGLARVTDNDKCYTLRTRRHFPIKWYPPESIEFGRFSEQTDIWSYGVTVFEIFSNGTDPLLPGLASSDGETETVSLDGMLDLLKKGIRLPCPESCPQSVYTQLMLPCWELGPRNRPTFRSLLGTIHRIESNLF